MDFHFLGQERFNSFILSMQESFGGEGEEGGGKLVMIMYMRIRVIFIFFILSIIRWLVFLGGGEFEKIGETGGREGFNN